MASLLDEKTLKAAANLNAAAKEIKAGPKPTSQPCERWTARILRDWAFTYQDSTEDDDGKTEEETAAEIEALADKVERGDALTPEEAQLLIFHLWQKLAYDECQHCGKQPNLEKGEQ